MYSLLVLVHGLWGTASQFDYICSQLAAEGAWFYDQEEPLPDNEKGLVVYRAVSFQNYKTYDGIDVNGVRVANEICNVITELEKLGPVDTLDVVGYSLGGLISRFALGVLYQRGVFDKVQPRVFTTFCTPHVGVKVLGEKLGTRLFNSIGSMSMASTSRQLFLRDKMANGRPLLLNMSDGVFKKALGMFQHRILYANVAYDMRCEWYTAGISTTDSYVGRPELLRGPYIDGYKPTIIDASEPPVFETSERKPRQRFSILAMLKFLLLPIWFLGFLINAAFQNITSSYRQTVFKKIERPEPLVEDELVEQGYDALEELYRVVNENSALQLDPTQVQIITSLNSLDWQKFPVIITNHHHAHAAVIVRYKNKNFDEGKLIIKHWIDTLDLNRG